MEESSAFLTKLQSKGFSVYHSVHFSEDNQSGFYPLFSAALWLHRTKDYGELSRYLAQVWSERLPTFWQVDSSQDLSILASALKSDLSTHFQHTPLGELIANWQLPSSPQTWTEVMDYCAVQLTWVERTGTGSVTYSYAPASANTWRLFVTIAEEPPFLYLLVHRDFEKSPVPGFPFYYPIPERHIPHPSPYKELTRLQADLLNNLLSTLSHLDSLPTGSKSLQDHISLLTRRIQPLSSGIDSVNLRSFLQLSERTTPPAHQSFSPHSANTCVSCHNVWSPSMLWRSDHGCALCLHCCFQQKDKLTCLSCNSPLSVSDCKKLRVFATISVGKIS